jgi:hypothetical protein
MSRYGVALFHTNSGVMRAEKILKQAELDTKLVPVPREFSSDCGTALRFEWLHREQVEKILAEAKVEIAALHPMP